MQDQQGPSRGHSHRSVFPNAWGRIPGERSLFEQGERNWGAKRGLFAKMDFLMPGRGFMAKTGIFSFGSVCGSKLGSYASNTVDVMDGACVVLSQCLTI